MPEVGLAITYGTAKLNGAEQQVYGYAERELLYWYDENNVRYLTPTEKSVMSLAKADAEAKKATEETKRADAELAEKIAAQQEIELLRERIRALGIDPDSSF